MIEPKGLVTDCQKISTHTNVWQNQNRIAVKDLSWTHSCMVYQKGIINLIAANAEIEHNNVWHKTHRSV